MAGKTESQKEIDLHKVTLWAGTRRPFSQQHLRTRFSMITFWHHINCFNIKPMSSQRKTAHLDVSSFTCPFPFPPVLDSSCFRLSPLLFRGWEQPLSPSGWLAVCSGVLLENFIPAWYRCRLHPLSTHLLFLSWLTASGPLGAKRGRRCCLCHIPTCFLFARTPEQTPVSARGVNLSSAGR